MQSRLANNRMAVRSAFEIRRSLGISLEVPVCVLDLASRAGLQVRFCEAGSLEGMYFREKNCILLPASRPRGRLRFTCAHELGHWVFKHGTRVDPIGEFDQLKPSNAEERMADLFAAYLLMPPRAVSRVFARRDWQIACCTPMQLFTAAGQLGVGYLSLANHLQFTLGLIDAAKRHSLLRTTPKELRETLLGGRTASELVIVDTQWEEVAVDLQVGDIALLARSVRIEGESIRKSQDDTEHQLVEAIKPGIAKATSADSDWAVFFRVSRRDYVGLGEYRHLEDQDSDE